MSQFLKYKWLILGGLVMVGAQLIAIYLNGNALLHLCFIGLIVVAFLYRIMTAQS